jgi:hypothetical protein
LNVITGLVPVIHAFFAAASRAGALGSRERRRAGSSITKALEDDAGRIEADIV